MHDELIRRLNETKTMSIVGMCKNAGKTTMLNWLLTAGHLRGTLGLTSIGRDGESTDVVTGTEKPGIFVKGDFDDHRYPYPAGRGGHHARPQRRLCAAGGALYHHAAAVGV